jgi:hypothetical protein
MLDLQMELIKAASSLTTLNEKYKTNIINKGRLECNHKDLRMRLFLSCVRAPLLNIILNYLKIIQYSFDFFTQLIMIIGM